VLTVQAMGITREIAKRDSGFSFPGEMTIEKSKLVTTLPSIGKEYRISFDLLVAKHTSGNVWWRNVIHFTTGGNDGTYGFRTPGVWIFKTNKLHVSSALNGNHNAYFDFPKQVEEGKWIKMQISQTLIDNKYIFEIQQNGKTMRRVENKQATEFKNVKMYVGDPWSPPVDGKLRNILVTDGADDTAGCKCGLEKKNRILGGQETKVNAYPWMAALTTTEEFFYCGGTLVAAEWVVTAAHCVFQDGALTVTTPVKDMKIVLGEHDKTATNSKIPRKVVAVKQIITHPNFKSETVENDLAMIKLAEPVDLEVYIPACLASPGQDATGQKALVYGWGTTAENGPTSDKLLEVEVPIVSNSVCQAAMKDLEWEVTSDMLCAGGNSGKDACQGDSGGPMTVSKGGQHTLVGSVSIGYGCGRANRYGIYARTAFFREWIDSTMADNGVTTKCAP